MASSTRGGDIGTLPQAHAGGVVDGVGHRRQRRHDGVLADAVTPSTLPVSGSTIAWAAREPPMSGRPVTSDTRPSGSTEMLAVASPPMLIQNPEATPRPWLGPSGAS